MPTHPRELSLETIINHSALSSYESINFPDIADYFHLPVELSGNALSNDCPNLF